MAGSLAHILNGDGAEPAEWLIWSNEHSAWWRPNSAGYTVTIELAGRYTKTEADRICTQANAGGGMLNPEFKTTVTMEMAVKAPEAS